jgi:hypothetical protein
VVTSYHARCAALSSILLGVPENVPELPENPKLRTYPMAANRKGGGDGGILFRVHSELRLKELHSFVRDFWTGVEIFSARDGADPRRPRVMAFRT